MSRNGFTTFSLPRFGLHERGFTLIELIVVFSVLAILSTVGIAAFSSYANAQKLQSATLQIKTLLTEARSKSVSQDNPCAGGTIFQGYEVKLCHGPGTPSCGTGNDYEIDYVCSGVATVVNETAGTFPAGQITVDSATTSPSTFLFIPITGGVNPSGIIVLDGANSKKQTITITTTGVIQ